MSPAPERPARRNFLRSLVHTCLFLLLPCQLALLWLAHNDRPVRLPDRLLSETAEALATKGVRFTARALMVNPDRSLRAEDVTLGFDGAGDGVISARSLDVRLSLPALAAGKLEPTGLTVTDAQVRLPGPLTPDGRPRTIADRIDCEVLREGRWLVIRSARLRSRGMTAFLSGEVPVATLMTGGRNGADLPAALRTADAWIRDADDFGLRSVEVRARSDGAGGATLRIEALAQPAISPPSSTPVRIEGLRIAASVGVRPDAGLGDWALEADAAQASASIGDIRMNLRGLRVAASPEPRHGGFRIIAKADEALADGLPTARLRWDTLVGREGPVETRFLLRTDGSRASGRLKTEGTAWRELTLDRADLCSEEMLSVAPLRKALADAGVGLSGSVILREARFVADGAGGLARATGAADLSGFSAMGLSSASIAPGAALPLSAGFDFDAARGPRPLRLTELQLATVRGEAELSLKAGGPFSLHLRGDLAPPCLDQVLGRWWTDLWSLFRVRRHPHAYIDVDGEWMKLGARTTGRVKLDDFTFMGAPFRGVEVTVDADARRTVIGLEDLAGGSLPAHGSVDGKVTWDWSLPPEIAGPNVDVSGDMEPWIAARCAGESFGEALKELRLPSGRRLRVVARPEGGKPAVTAEISAPGISQAWGFPLLNLKAKTEGAGERMTIRTTFGLADGEARLDVKGDVLRKPAVDFSILGSRPELLLAAFEGTQVERTGNARLDLSFKGTVDLRAPRQLRGLGDYRLVDPELKKVRLLGGLSGLLEELGVNLTSYDLQEARGTFGCLEGKAYLPDLAVTGPQAMLTLSGVGGLEGGQLDFIGDFSLMEKQGIPLIGLLNPNRALIGLTKIRVKGSFSKPETSALPRLSDFIKSKKDSDLGKIPDVLKE